MCRLVKELFAECGLGIGGLCHDEQSARVFVDTMDESYSGVVGIEGLEVAQMPCHGINERAVEVACSWMHDHACRLVDHQYVVVLIDDVERDVFRLDR